MADVQATRSALLGLADERTLMKQGYAFLDEKRMLLATDMLSRLKAHETLAADFEKRFMDAREALKKGVARHGLDGLEVYPAPDTVSFAPETSAGQFLGVRLLDGAAPQLQEPAGAPRPPVDPSPEAADTAAAFAALLPLLFAIAVEVGNLERLAREYKRTERRARSLENVLLPEVEETMRMIEGHLESADQEDAIRTRFIGSPE